MDEPHVEQTAIDGLFLIRLVVHPDDRGSFREAYQAEKLETRGLPRLGPVQWNISENLRQGILRGIHAEPWDKYSHVIAGRVFAAIVDFRPSSRTFGQHLTFELDRTNALFVSKGLGNSYQVLEENTIYGYLVNAHWKKGQQYLGVAWNDPTLNIQWPLPVGENDVSEKDGGLPSFTEVFRRT